MRDRFGYVDGYIYGQHDALTWLSMPPDPNDARLAAFDFRVQMRAALVCLARNLYIAGGLCASFRAGWHSGFDAAHLTDEPGWYPGCGSPIDPPTAVERAGKERR